MNNVRVKAVKSTNIVVRWQMNANTRNNTNNYEYRKKTMTYYRMFSRSFKHSMLDVWAFAEWCGLTYVRLNDCWVHRYADQRNRDNWKDTGELWKLWWENYR